MDKVQIKQNATIEDKWNSLVDALYSENNYENPTLNHLLTSLDFYNEVRSGQFEGVVEAYEEQIEADGVHQTKDAIAESLRYIGADGAADIVSSTLPTLKNAYDKYDRVLARKEVSHVLQEGYAIAFTNVNRQYAMLGDSYLKDKIEHFIDTRGEELFTTEQ